MATIPTPFPQPHCASEAAHRLTSKSRRNRTELEVQATVFSDEAIEALVSEWLVPVIVDHIIADLLGAEAEACR